MWNSSFLIFIFLLIGWAIWAIAELPSRIEQNEESQLDLNTNRMITWVFTLLFTYFPFITLVTVNHLNGTLSRSVIEDSPDLLFTVVVVPAIAWNNVREFRERIDGTHFSTVVVVFLLLALAGSTLYGIHSLTLLTDDLAFIRKPLLNFTILLSLLALVMGSTTEIIIARHEGRKQ